MTQQHEDSFFLSDVYWANDRQGQYLIPYIFNTTKTKIKRLDNGEQFYLDLEYYPSHCKIAGERLLREYGCSRIDLTPNFTSNIILNSFYPKERLGTTSNKILIAYANYLREFHNGSIPTNNPSTTYDSTLEFVQTNAFTASEIAELATIVRIHMAKKYKEKYTSQLPIKPFEEPKQLTPYEQQFEF